MWLSGPAGAGKTAIAGSIAVACKKEGSLAATFFFSSFSPSNDMNSKCGFVATLAHQISQHDALHQFQAHLLMAIERHPDIFHKNLMEQVEGLILGPFQMMVDQIGRVGWPKVVIVDGLDEVVAAQYHKSAQKPTSWTSQDDQLEILNILLALSQSPSFPLRIFISSRPERNIAEFFAADARAFTIDLFLDSKYKPDADIRCFLEAKFGTIRRRSSISNLSWPGESALDRIVGMSSGQFIIPATVVRWVEAGVPQEQLDDILQLERVNVGTKNPFAPLDALYRHILTRANNPDDDPHLVVKWILCIDSALKPSGGAKFWRQLLENTEGELTYRMAPISSLVSVPPAGNTSSPITIYHKSLSDFLATATRCGDLYVDATTFNSFVACGIVKVLK